MLAALLASRFHSRIIGYGVDLRRIPASDASDTERFEGGSTPVIRPIQRVDCCGIERGLSTDSHRRFLHHRCRHGIVITIPANVENRSRSHWNRVHVPLESAFTMRWKP
jgi:hypothetical protein